MLATGDHLRSPVKVLLIEDNPGDARWMREMLSAARGDTFALECVERLEPGIERLAEGDVGLVLLDLTLPDSEGFATFSTLHAKAADLPIVVLSGLADEALAIRTVREGAQDYLVKGQVDGHSLVRAMRYAIERKSAEVQLAAYARAMRERNEQMEEELRMARELQLAMLPQQFPCVPRDAAPQDSAVRFFTFYSPTGPVSGDFFDVIALSDTAVGVLICDVMGHDVRAALVTAMMRALVEELGTIAADPGRVLTHINRGLTGILKHSGSTLYATAFYLVADVGRAEVSYANAGHPSPLHLRRRTGRVDSIDAEAGAGPALGLFEDAVYATHDRSMAAGDLIMMFTDGLFEVVGADHEPYGRERLLAEVRQRLALPPRDLFAEVLAEVKTFSPRKEFADDVCLVGMEVTRLC